MRRKVTAPGLPLALATSTSLDPNLALQGPSLPKPELPLLNLVLLKVGVDLLSIPHEAYHTNCVPWEKGVDQSSLSSEAAVL